MGRRLATALVVTALLAASGPALAQEARAPRGALFIGVDTSGSFRQDYDNALSFLAYYIYGHLRGLGGLSRPRELFVAPIGGRDANEPKAFRPIHDFAGKSIPQLEADLRRWYPPADTLTDFNAFFRQVARIAKERNLVLSPITIMVATDGVPDVPGGKAGATALYRKIDLDPLEFLSRNLTLRLAYTSPRVGDNWRKHVERRRVRLWTAEAEVMKSWSTQLIAGAEPASQVRLWKWVRDNVDFRVRSRAL